VPSNHQSKEGETPVKRFVLLTLAASTLGGSQGAAADKNPIVVMDTSMGKIEIELNRDKAPITVNNFLNYVDKKFYDGTIFHRVIENFMVQGGGFEPGLKEKDTEPPIKNESFNGLSNKRGTIAMARTPDPNSATAQFFINVEDNAGLDKARSRDGVGYCVFGKVLKGMDVVDKIRKVKKTSKTVVGRRGRQEHYDDVPVEDVIIKSVRLEKEKDKN
jgi:cyclophilin family peptidyl-prolyl cis-trans isomerase